MNSQEPPKPKRPKARVLSINPDSMAPSLELLNSCAIFQRRIQFVRIWRTGALIEAEFSNGRTARWFTSTDLRTFARSQDIIFEATGFLIPTPPKATITQVWEPIAQLVRNVSDQNATEIEHSLKDEFLEILPSIWIKAGRPTAENYEEFFALLQKCQKTIRNTQKEAPPLACVWLGGEGEQAKQYAWVYQEALMDWLSSPHGKHKHYPWDDVRKALLMLGFTRGRLQRSLGKETVKVRVWRGQTTILKPQSTKKANVPEFATA